MARRPLVRATALYKPDPGEVFQVTVEVDESFPDAVQETSRAATKGVRDMLNDALALAPDTSDEQWAELAAAAEEPDADD